MDVLLSTDFLTVQSADVGLKGPNLMADAGSHRAVLSLSGRGPVLV